MSLARQLGKVENIMSRDFHTIEEDELLSKAVGMFKEGLARPTGALVVVDSKGSYRGILTERMIVRSRLNPKETKVKAVSGSSPKLSSRDYMVEGVRLMAENDVKHLPVIENDKVVGVVTDEDVIRMAVRGNFGLKPVKDVMSKEPRVVEENASIASALALMREEGISRLPVVRNAKLVGIVSMHDIVERLVKPRDSMRFGDLTGERLRPLSAAIKSIMTKTVITAPPNTSLRNAVELMLKHDIASLVILDEGRIAGIMTKTDILSAIAEEAKGAKGELLVQLLLNPLNIDWAEYERMMADANAFAKKYSNRLGRGTMTAHFRQFRQKFKGAPLINCRIRINSEGGQYVGVGDGWGFSNALQTTLERVERRMLRSSEIEREPRLTEEFINKALELWY